ncbi:ATP-binding protein [Streptomyces sp. NPDC023838]|uniref:ATP-binding protein n=1 Tax=Streptomyces sp. NPDC023838 TaxID=3154325 RepID=UPI0033F23008
MTVPSCLRGGDAVRRERLTGVPPAVIGPTDQRASIPPYRPHAGRPEVGSESLPALTRTGDADPGLERGISPAVFAAHQFRAVPRSVAESRAFVLRCLTRWRLSPHEPDNGHLAHDTQLVVSELMTNALRHASPRAQCLTGPFWLALHLRVSDLVCAVSDPSPAPPRLLPPPRHGEPAHGLQIVAALSSAWGWAPSPPPGKTVWTRIPLSP